MPGFLLDASDKVAPRGHNVRNVRARREG